MAIAGIEAPGVAGDATGVPLLRSVTEGAEAFRSRGEIPIDGAMESTSTVGAMWPRWR